VTHQTRIWRKGRLEREHCPLSQISDYIGQEDVLVWLDLGTPDGEELSALSEELGLDPLAVEDALSTTERAKVDRYPGYLFLNVYDVRLDADTCEVATSFVSAFVTEQALVTVRPHGGTFDTTELVRRWDSEEDLAQYGVAFLLHGLIDVIVDGHFEAVQSLDGQIDQLEEQLFDETFPDRDLQRNAFQARKSLVMLRRVVLPMREVVNTLLRRDLHIVPTELAPYFEDVYDHALRAADWTDSLRDLVSTILDTRIALQGNRMNEVMKQVTSWAAIIAVPTAVTGYYGMNVPYPGFGTHWGFEVSIGVLVVSAVVLYLVFKRKGWL
jgi:magnesium transporter